MGWGKEAKHTQNPNETRKFLTQKSTESVMQPEKHLKGLLYCLEMEWDGCTHFVLAFCSFLLERSDLILPSTLQLTEHKKGHWTKFVRVIMMQINDGYSHGTIEKEFIIACHLIKRNKSLQILPIHETFESFRWSLLKLKFNSCLFLTTLSFWSYLINFLHLLI